ncbi:probable E3 ubiquitin-protein ligase HERC3 isoform X8 [Oncorhynchus tshawytscha]|uniref:probable E3 ubiquitin-protein ligase HERC3 isoform X8 n=1 Tax=Oncorhynchus tshawytscha TaxID=74940 RepID=UPI001C3DD079|nr:probable E3 ubiquitin-protein ligase HERC3 isoform X8 [Oncorhynchus tshawytscha]
MFCWGDGSSGQFGLNFENVSVPIAGNIFSDKVTEIACGEQHTLFLTVDGRILSCGRNSKGQLGRQKKRDSKLPAPVEGLGVVVSVACGQDHSVALCASGQVYSWGAGGEGQLGIALTTVSKVPRPRSVPIPLPLPITVIQVACGNSHSLALTKGGQVFSWGLNSHGQLGLGKGVPLQPIPALVCSLIGVPVTQVAAGGTHTLALTLPGLVYCCGANRAGQLGLNRVDEKGRFNICSVPALRVLGVSFISCGEAHSAVLTKVSYYYCGEGHCCSHQGIILLLWRGTLLFSPRYHTITVERDTVVLTKVSYYYCIFTEGPKGDVGVKGDKYYGSSLVHNKYLMS